MNLALNLALLISLSSINQELEEVWCVLQSHHLNPVYAGYTERVGYISAVTSSYSSSGHEVEQDMDNTTMQSNIYHSMLIIMIFLLHDTLSASGWL